MRKQSEWIFPIKNIDVLLFGFSILIGSLLFNSSNAFAYTKGRLLQSLVIAGTTRQLILFMQLQGLRQKESKKVEVMS